MVQFRKYALFKEAGRACREGGLIFDWRWNKSTVLPECDSKYRNGKDEVSEEISTRQAMIMVMAKCFVANRLLGCQNHEGGVADLGFQPRSHYQPNPNRVH